MSRPTPLLAELKRRKVIRVAVVYAATAFAVLQGADIMLPRMGVPEWGMNLVVALTLLGFPIALVLGWALELTPDGIKRTEPAPAETSNAATPPLLGKRTVFAAALLVVLGVGIGAGWFLRPGSGPDATSARQSEQTAGPDVSAETSIAVLPFLNMSTDPENAFFADGISEELLNILVGVEGLKVASRTSSFSFKGKDTPMPEIARQLGVQHILEGSVRRQGNRVRITAQLIETRSDTHLWSETFERDLVDIFRVQEEIARAITTALQGVLGVRKVSVATPTANLEAYERFLRGRTRFYQRVGLDEAIADLQFAVERDPGFAEAWAFLGAASFVVGNGGYPSALNRDVLLAQALPAAERALALNPDLGIALAVKGQSLTRTGDSAQIAEGIRLLERAADRVAADTSARLWLGLTWLSLGFVERALPHFASAQDQDPLVAINNGYLGLAYAIQGRWQEGGRLAQRAVELSALPFWTNNIAIGLANDGRDDEALQLLSAAQPMLADVPQLGGEYLAGLLAALEDPARRAEFLAANEFDAAQENAVPALVAALMFGDADRVFRADSQPGTRLTISVASWLPSLGWLREDPRFYALMQKTGAAGFWEAQGYPRGCRPVDEPAGRRLDCSGYAP
jgi:TolB-like protein/tetratricopeptide (TPR) repeat protein